MLNNALVGIGGAHKPCSKKKRQPITPGKLMMIFATNKTYQNQIFTEPNRGVAYDLASSVRGELLVCNEKLAFPTVCQRLTKAQSSVPPPPLSGWCEDPMQFLTVSLRHTVTVWRDTTRYTIDTNFSK